MEHILCVCVYMHMCVREHVIQDIERPTLTEAWCDSEFQTQCLISLPGSKHDTCFSEFHTPTCQYCPCWGCVWKGRWGQEGSHHCLLLFSHSLTTENKRDLSETRNQVQWDLKLPRHGLELLFVVLCWIAVLTLWDCVAHAYGKPRLGFCHLKWNYISKCVFW